MRQEGLRFLKPHFEPFRTYKLCNLNLKTVLAPFKIVRKTLHAELVCFHIMRANNI